MQVNNTGIVGATMDVNAFIDEVTKKNEVHLFRFMCVYILIVTCYYNLFCNLHCVCIFLICGYAMRLKK